MALKLERGDLLQLQPISNTNTLKLLPLGKKNKQKLVIGDDSGQVSCYEFKRGEPQVVFQSKLFEGPITSVALAGPPSKKDNIFISYDQRIVGMSKKGKEFFKVTSTSTETIQNIAVEDVRAWVGFDGTMNIFNDGKEDGYYMSRDTINHLLVAHVTRDTDWDCVLACKDNFIRIMHKDTLFLEIPTDASVTSVAFMEIESDQSSIKGPTAIVYGLADGTLGLLQVFSNGENNKIWTIEDGQARSAITCISIYDIDKDKAMEIIIGRDDGRVEVFKQQPDSLFAVPYKVFTKNIGESVRAVECGIVSTPEFHEIIVASYSGKLISFTTEPVHSRATEDSYGRSIQTISNENRIKHLRKEIDEMKKKLDKDREKFKKTNGSAVSLEAQHKPAPDFPVISKFTLDTTVAAYVLTVELQSSIDLIILRSPVVLDLVETDTGSSVLSVTPPALLAQVGGGGAVGGGGGGVGEENLGKFVAVFRCQSQEKRIVLTLRTNEGEFGNLHITIVADSVPKAAKIIKYDLKPLSLHTKLYELSREESARPKSSMRYTGNVQLGTLHEWVQAIFPDVPPRLDEGVLDQVYCFRNTFTGATTKVEFRKNEIKFESENASTIAIIKENITRLANYRRIALEESVTPVEASIASFLTLIRPKLDYQFSLARKMELVDAVQEIAMIDNNGTNEWMSEEYKEILRDQETIRQQFKARDKSLEYLSGIVTDLFVDWNRLQGVDAKHKLPQLMNTIHANNMEGVLTAFQELSVSRR